MTDKTKRIEEKFNKGFRQIPQAEPGTAKRTKFDRDRFVKAAQELQKVVKANDERDPSKS
ncbi:MAG TPA: hypothetical protein VGO07_07025 [Candidatus Saccharimonadales bacterium]|nr:hypothetical protein [Candidatus Saccharimonadales bacterium]